jgi:hypothetical protein
MKTIIKYLTIWFLTISLFGFYGCKEKLTQCEEHVNVEYSPLYSEGEGFYLKNIEDNNEITKIIASQVDYQKYVVGNQPLPVIDFNENVLICGRIYLTTCGSIKKQSFIKNCEKLNYKIELERLDCQKPTEIFHFAIIPKKYQSLNLTIEKVIIQ